MLQRIARSGSERAEPVAQATNGVLHPWLKRELSAILAQCPPPPTEPTPGQCWSDWGWHEDAYQLDQHVPPVQVRLIWDNLKGHVSTGLVQWLGQRGIVPCTPSWVGRGRT